MGSHGLPGSPKPHLTQLDEEDTKAKHFTCISMYFLLLHLTPFDGECIDVDQDVACFMLT